MCPRAGKWTAIAPCLFVGKPVTGLTLGNKSGRSQSCCFGTDSCFHRPIGAALLSLKFSPSAELLASCSRAPMPAKIAPEQNQELVQWQRCSGRGGRRFKDPKRISRSTDVRFQGTHSRKSIGALPAFRKSVYLGRVHTAIQQARSHEHT